MNFPLSYYPFAEKAAEAAECAHNQGDFWAYHDRLFQNQHALDTESLKRHTFDIGLDAEAFETCLDSGAAELQVLKDFRDGQWYDVPATQRFFMSRLRLIGVRPFSSI